MLFVSILLVVVIIIDTQYNITLKALDDLKRKNECRPDPQNATAALLVIVDEKVKKDGNDDDAGGDGERFNHAIRFVNGTWSTEGLGHEPCGGKIIENKHGA